MKIVYDDLPEFAEVRLRCENTRKKVCANIVRFLTGVK